MRARFLSRRENKQRKRERRKRKQFRNHLLSAPCFFLIYLYMENRTPPSGFSHCNKTGVQKVFFKVSRKEYSPRISFEWKGTKRETNCRINKHAACPRAILDESNRERRPPTIPSREIIPTSLLWLQIIMGGGSGAYFTTQVRLIVLPLFTNRSGAPMMMVIGSETKFFLFFYFFQEQNIKVIPENQKTICNINIVFYFWLSVVIIFYNFDQEFLYTCTYIFLLIYIIIFNLCNLCM